MNLNKIFIIACTFILFSGFAAAEELTPVKVQLNWFHEAEFAGYYAAIDQGYYGEEGLAIELIEGFAGIDLGEEMEKNSAQFVIMDVNDIINNIAEGHELKAVSAIFQKHPSVWFALKDSEINTPTDFIGKKIGIKNENWRDYTHLLLKNAGVSKENIVEVETGDDITKLYDGTIDIFTGYAWDEPVETELAGHKVDIIYGSDYGIGNYAGMIVTQSDLINTNPVLVEKFIRASLKGWKHAIDNPDLAAQLAINNNPELNFEHQRLAMDYLHPLIFYNDAFGCINEDRLIGYEYTYDDSFVKEICTNIVYPPITEEKFTWFIIGIIIILIIPALWLWLASRGGKKK